MSLLNNSKELYTIQAACGCHKGLRRTNNEDNFYFDGDFLSVDNDGMGSILTCTRTISDSMDGNDSFFAVYDGMGGGQYGEVASFTASSLTREFFDNREGIKLFDVEQMLIDLALSLNDAVFEESLELMVNQMGSTQAACYFYAGHVWTCNVGDSRCYRFRNGVLEQTSVDHNDAETMKLNGVTGRKPYLTQYLGVDPDEMRISPSVSKDVLEDGDIYLVCSDGLTDMLEEERIAEILADETTEEEKVQTLIVEALKKGGKDNTTVIVCTIRE